MRERIRQWRMSLNHPAIERSPLGFILDEILGCLNAGFHYAPVSVTLSLPDICSALEVEPGQDRFGKVGERYRRWCEVYAEPKFSSVKAIDLWCLRGGIHHNAMLSGHPSNKRGRLLLMPANSQSTGPNELEVSNCGTPPQDGLQIFIPYFCHQMIEAATDWWGQNHDDGIVRQNLPNLVQYRPRGLAPFMVGAPVLA